MNTVKIVNRFNTLCYRFAKYVAEKKASAEHHQQTIDNKRPSVEVYPLPQINFSGRFYRLLIPDPV
ncbi:hypothetical protein CMK14_08895 [Candidatus Poribacteria bacterium]|jgi:hypothetical protein|nr:hypothetical protein [Candidatus Poribacteria bacterium]